MKFAIHNNQKPNDTRKNNNKAQNNNINFPLARKVSAISTELFPWLKIVTGENVRNKKPKALIRFIFNVF